MKTDRFYLELALEDAERAGWEGTYPIGALVVSPDGIILGRGRNHVYSAGFARLLLTATPEPDLADRVQKLMQGWIADPKPQKLR